MPLVTDDSSLDTPSLRFRAPQLGASFRDSTSSLPVPLSAVTRSVLPNGLTVLVHHSPESEVVAIVTHVKVGYFDEPDDVVGISHVVEHMFFKGTPRFGVGEIAQATKAAGGYLNAHTIYDHTSYYVVLPANRFSAGLEIQADAYANSLIDAGELARELEVIIEEAKRKTDNPSAVATETLYELLHDRHRMRRWRIGHEHELRSLTRAAVQSFYRNYYRPSNSILAIAGGVEPERALEEAERLYGALEDDAPTRSIGPSENGTGGFRCRELQGDVTQTRVLAGWRVPAIGHPASAVLDVAASVLSAGRASRLYRAVRERSLAVSASASNYTLPELGVFTVHLEAEPEKALPAARAAWGEIARLSEELLPPHEVQRAVSVYDARWQRGLETMEGRANFLAAWEALGDWQMGEKYRRRVLAATPTDIRAAVQEYLDPERVAVLTYRPAAAPPLASDAAAMRRELATVPEPVPVAAPPEAVPLTERRRARFDMEIAGVRVYRTEHGMPILVRRHPGSLFAQMGAYAAAGASSDPLALAGQTLLLCRTAVKGTRTRAATALAEAAEALGSSIGAAPSADSLGWSIAVPLERREQAAALLADVVQEPAFAVESLAVERAAALSALALSRDDMFTHPLRLLARAAFGDHPYGLSVAGTEEGLAAVSAEAIAAAHAERVMHGAAVIGIVADAEPDEVADLAASAFGRIAPGKRPAIDPPRWMAQASREESRDKAQTALLLAFPGPARRDPDRHAAALLVKIASGLGGRFFEELRDRQSLAYTVHAFAASRPLAGLVGAYIATSPDKEAAAHAGLLLEFERLRREPPTDEELMRAQEYSVGTEIIRRESGAAVLAEMIDAWMFGELEELERYEQDIRAVSREDLLHLAAKYLDPGQVVEAAVRGRGHLV